MTRSKKTEIPAISDTAQPEERLGEFILYTTQDGTMEIQLRQVDGGFWLSQKEIAILYQVSVPAITQHLRTIFESGELVSESVIKNYLITASNGKKYKTRLYSLEAVLAVGYRVRSHRGVQFRQWATEHLNEFLVKGFILDDARLKEGYIGPVPSWMYIRGQTPRKLTETESGLQDRLKQSLFLPLFCLDNGYRLSFKGKTHLLFSQFSQSFQHDTSSLHCYLF